MTGLSFGTRSFPAISILRKKMRKDRLKTAQIAFRTNRSSLNVETVDYCPSNLEPLLLLDLHGDIIRNGRLAVGVNHNPILAGRAEIPFPMSYPFIRHRFVGQIVYHQGQPSLSARELNLHCLPFSCRQGVGITEA